jgi:hypothetical protein
VSKKKTWRISASSGSMPNDVTVERWSDSGTVSFSSTLSASSMSANIRSSSSSSSGLVLVAEATGRS